MGRRVRAALAALALLPGVALAQACPDSLAGKPIGFQLAALDAVRRDAGAMTLPPKVKSAYDAVVSDAESALGRGPYTVTDKTRVPPSGDKKDYASLAPYWWPDPSKPDGLPYRRRDGQTNPERDGDAFDKTRATAMVEGVFALAVAAYLTGEPRYAEYADHLIAVWFVDPATAMNPSLTYAQSVPGQSEGRGIGIIDSRAFQEVADAAALLALMGALDEGTEAGFRQWIGAYAAWLIQSDNGKEERAEENNHGTFYDSQLVHFLVYAGRCDLAARVIEDTKARVVSQIRPNGIMPHEAKRTRSMHYHGFNAEAFLRLSLMAERLGVDLYDYEVGASGSVRDALRKLGAYNGRADAWPYERQDRRGERTLWQALTRSLMLDPDDAEIRTALRRFDAGEDDDVLRLLTYGL